MLVGTNGNDCILGHGGNDQIDGRGGNDVLIGGEGDDRILGGNGNDRIFGEDGNDHIEGGNGDDFVDGGEGDDEIWGGNGADALHGGHGSDVLHGENGRDHLVGGFGDDALYGGNGDDLLEGGFGDDALYGDNGNDELRGEEGDDLLDGAAGNDRLFGGPGDDILIGGSGDDLLDGGEGNDVLDGGAGNNVLIGGPGNDILLDDARGGRTQIDGGDGFDACVGTNCEADPPARTGCQSDGDCGSGLCIAEVGACIACRSDASCETAQTGASRVCRPKGMCLPTVGCEYEEPICDPSNPPRGETTPVGNIRSSFEVTGNGAAEYEIPIDVPPGRAGIEPVLSLRYNSQSPQSSMGIGWSVEGLSVIHRCFSHGERSSRIGGAQSTDGYCLDGEELVRIGDSSDFEHFVTKRNSFSRIGRHRDGWWEVKTKDGRVLRYGTTMFSRLELRPEPSSEPKVVSWHLTRVADRHGNYMTVEYVRRASAAFSNINPLPSSIRYTGHESGVEPDREVRFEYFVNEQSVRAGHFGALVDQPWTLKKVRTFTVGARAVRTYDVEYREGSTYGRRFVSSVSECAASGTSQVCKPPVSFDYSSLNPSVRVPTRITFNAHGDRLAGC